MMLDLGRISVEQIEWGRSTLVDGSTLSINREELVERTWGGDSRIVRIAPEIARPGERTRIIPVKDVIEPRAKVEGRGGVFPGMISGVETVGQGRTHVLEGCAVATVGRIVGFQEGLIDMSGPGARYSVFSKLVIVALVIDVREDVPRRECEEALRMAGLRAAAYLGEAGRPAKPRVVERLESHRLSQRNGSRKDLPRLAYLYTLLSQGLLHDTYLYGRDLKTILPTIIAGAEAMDGAIVSGNCVSACDKNTTYHHQNNPVLAELYKRDSKDVHFVGTVVSNCNVRLTGKIRSAEYAVKLLELLDVDGVIISKEGFGNPDADAMMACRMLEEKGIATVLITDEFAGADGASQSLADTTPHANAVVSVGNANEMVSLPAMERVIGDISIVDRLAGGQPGSLSNPGVTAELQVIMGATNQLGFERLSTRES